MTSGGKHRWKSDGCVARTTLWASNSPCTPENTSQVHSPVSFGVGRESPAQQVIYLGMQRQCDTISDNRAEIDINPGADTKAVYKFVCHDQSTQYS